MNKIQIILFPLDQSRRMIIQFVVICIKTQSQFRSDFLSLILKKRIVLFQILLLSLNLTAVTVDAEEITPDKIINTKADSEESDPSRISIPENQVNYDDDSGLDYRTKGDQAFNDFFYDIAENMYQKYLNRANDPDNITDACVRLVKSLIKQQKLAKAEEILDSVHDILQKNHRSILDNSSQDASKSSKNSLTITYWQGQLLLINQEFEEAAELFADVANKAENVKLKRNGYLGLGESHLALKNWDDSESAFHQAIENVVVEELLHNAHLGLIRLSLARKNFTHADDLINTNWENAKGEYRNNLGILKIASFLSRKKWEEAYSFYMTTFSNTQDHLLQNSEFDIIRNLGLGLIEDKSYKNAMILFEHMLPLLKNENQKKWILLDLAEATDKMGNKAKAINHYSTYLNLYKNDNLNPKIQLRIAQLYETDEQQLDQALRFYLKVYEKKENSALNRYQAAQGIGWIHKRKKNYDKSIKYFYESSTLDVSNIKKAKGIYYASEIYFLIKDFNNAAIYYLSVVDQYPESEYIQDSQYKYALARYKGKRYRMAAEAFTLYLKKWPEDKNSEEALLYKGAAQHMAEDYTDAIISFQKFIKDHPKSENVTQAYLEASQSAAAADMQPDAIKFLNKIIENHKNSKDYPYALYKRAYLRLSYGYYKEGRNDSYSFLKQFAGSHSELSSDVYLWLGDHYANNQDFGQAEQLFLEIVNRYKNSPSAPIALYEAAKASYKNSKLLGEDYNKTLKHINQLLTVYPDAPKRVLAQAEFLRGDIASITGDFEEAKKRFKACSDLVPRTDLHYAAIGRLAECHYSEATINDNPIEEYQQALVYFNEIINANTISNSLVELARYRAGKIYEFLKQPEKAIDEYFHIFFKYDYDLRNHKINDWYYFARSGFDLARLYLDKNEYTSAKTIYNRLAKADIPISEDALLRAQEIDNQYLKK